MGEPMTSTEYRFRPTEMRDLPLLRSWQSLPHVQEWWGNDEPFDEAGLRDPRISRWIVEVNDKPFAYMQDYAVHGWVEHHFRGLPAKSRGIDQYIGDPLMIGCGHGTGFIRQRMLQLFAARVPVIAVDPHPANTRAIEAYRKLGFEISGGEQETSWGLIVPMEARNPKDIK